MQTVRAVVFEDADIDAFKRVERWVRLHPRAEEPSERSKGKLAERGVDLGDDIRAALRGVTEHREPLFRERLQKLWDYLADIHWQARDESDVKYWTDRGCAPSMAAVMAESRVQADLDVMAAGNVLAAALEVAEPGFAWKEERFADV